MSTDRSTEWAKLDDQMRHYSPRLRDDLRIEAVASNRLASAIAGECATLSPEALAKIRQQDVVGIDGRHQELVVFQAFMDVARSVPPHPAIVRAQVVTQNYVCFVYLGDSCFKVLQKHMLPTTATRRCCRFLTDNPVRAFRNALAHGNWTYNADFSGIRFWARKGSDPTEPLTEFEVSQLELGFWQSLARCVAYVAFSYAKQPA